MMERLTEKFLKEYDLKGMLGYSCASYCNYRSNYDEFCDECVINKAIQKLAYYEDLAEQGRLIELPCKVGDSIYEPTKDGRILEWEITNIGTDGENIIFWDELDYFYDETDIGETVFLTREEAEAKLKELESE